MNMSLRRLNAMERTDAMTKAQRELVHEFGLPIVSVCLKHGVERAAAIREIVREIWSGARQEGQRCDARGTLDWLLMQSGSNVSAKTLCRILADNNLFIVSAEPSRAMLTASMAEVSGHNVRCTREEKHRRRLRAAIRAAAADYKGLAV